jgi:PPOX class probable F420-dependent enzyme
MPGQRERIAMSGVEVADLLDAGRTLVLVTTGPDGVGDPVPMWYVRVAGEVRMRTFARSQKAVNVRRDPRVSCLVETGERYAELRGVQLTGTIELVEDEDWIAAVWAGLLVRYGELPADREVEARAALRERAGKQVGMRLVPSRVVSWDHRKLEGSGRP